MGQFYRLYAECPALPAPEAKVPPSAQFCGRFMITRFRTFTGRYLRRDLEQTRFLSAFIHLERSPGDLGPRGTLDGEAIVGRFVGS